VLAALPPLLFAKAAWGATGNAPPRIGWLKIQGPQHTPGQLQAFRAGLRQLGLIEGRDYALEERYADNDGTRLPHLAMELLSRGVRVIIATSQPSIVAAARVTRRVPVIGRMNDDPTTNGMAQTLARPGGNITGIYAMTEELNQKRLELLKEAVPSLHRVGVLLRPNWSNAKHDWQVALAAAQQLHLELLPLDVHSADDITTAIGQASTKKIEGITTFRNPTVVTYLKLIAELCREHRLPGVFDAREYVAAGGLMSYGPNINAIYRQLASYAAKLLHGTPADQLPIEQPTIFELVLNRRTANTIGVVLPPSLFARADEVID
jgi:ABC-type uncharacterized transport system substrate-binding protein